MRAVVYAQLSVDPQTRAHMFEVRVEEGTVYLSGATATRREQARAVEIARSVEGVTDVVSTLVLKDSAIRAAVVSALSADEQIGRIPMSVEVTDGVVKLESADTGPEDRRRAIAIASAVEGVVKVEDWMK